MLLLEATHGTTTALGTAQAEACKMRPESIT